jgi:uncharacterized protein with PQ loop repeat
LSVVDQRVHSFTSKKMASFFELLFSVIMIFAPVVGYIPQYFKIKQTRRSEGFSIFVSLVLLLANIVRLFFWIGKRFELTLMWQSVVMIVAQLMLLDICIRTRKLNEIHKRKHITAWAISTFWNWEDFSDYLLFLGGFTLAVGFLSLLFISQRWFVELLGSLALGIEAFLGVPQAYNNWKNQSTAGLSVALIVSWFVGDSFKTIYFIVNNSPLQFLFCVGDISECLGRENILAPFCWPLLFGKKRALFFPPLSYHFLFETHYNIPRIKSLSTINSFIHSCRSTRFSTHRNIMMMNMSIGMSHCLQKSLSYYLVILKQIYLAYSAKKNGVRWVCNNLLVGFTTLSIDLNLTFFCSDENGQQIKMTKEKILHDISPM